MNHSIIGATPAFDVYKLKDSLLANDAGEWGKEPGNDAIGVIRSTNFSNEGYLFLDDIAYRTLTASKKKEKLINDGDILIERSGGSNTQPVGRVGFIDKVTAEKELVFANFIQRICVDGYIFYPKFAYYCLQQMYEMGITSNMQFQTTGIRNLDYKYYLKSKLPKPDLSEQKSIAGIISKVDEAIEAVENSIKSAERLKKSLMQNLLTGKLKPDGTWRSEDEFFVDEKFGKVPKGWTVKRLKDLILFHQYGMNISSSDSGTVPMFRMNNVIDGRMVDSPMVMVNISDSDFEKYKVEKGDILFNRTNSLDLVGKIGIFDMDGDYVFASYLIRIRAIKDNEPEYLNYYLNSYKGQTSLRAKATPAVSQANINAKSLVQTYVPRPPKETQTEIVQLIKSYEDIKLEHAKKLQALKTLKKALMQNLLTGKVRVDVEKINKILEEV